jgi:hypothetical protein
VKLDKAIEDVHNAEAELAKQLRSVGERHAAEPDLYHLGQTLARQCAEHLGRLAPFAQRYGAGTHHLESPRRGSTEPDADSAQTGLLLLRDLRELYLAAQDAEMTWVILNQAARAVRDWELVEVAGVCQEAAQARAKWVRTRIKESCTQVLASG